MLHFRLLLLKRITLIDNFSLRFMCVVFFILVWLYVVIEICFLVRSDGVGRAPKKGKTRTPTTTGQQQQ